MIDVDVVLVTVTYGERAHLLRQVLDAVRYMDISKVVVVNNGSAWPVGDDLLTAYPDLITVVEMGKNTGSAQGFASGIQRALDLDAKFIWLLDDDNRPRGDTLQTLRDAYSEALACTPRDRLAVLAFRPEHQADVAAGVAMDRINPRTNSFRGFHMMDIPYKLWRRTTWGRPRVIAGLPKFVKVDMSVYSGLLFHRDMILNIGLPDSDFVLYGDDNELTYRVTRMGGKVLLITSAEIDELESSWNVKKRFSIAFIGNLKGMDDYRAYYGMRNGVYLDTITVKKNAFIFWINRKVYILLLYIYSLLLRKGIRYRLLRRAIKDGLSGKLGLDESFPL